MNEFIFPRIRTFVSHQPHRNMSLEQLQATLDEHKQNMPEGTYLSLCNLSKDVHELLAGKDKSPRKTKRSPKKTKRSPKKTSSYGGLLFYFLNSPAKLSVRLEHSILTQNLAHFFAARDFKPQNQIS